MLAIPRYRCALRLAAHPASRRAPLRGLIQRRHRQSGAHARLPTRLPRRQPRRRAKHPCSRARCVTWPRRTSPFTLIDTHAGAGGYSIEGRYAQKNGEYGSGIGALYDATDPPAPLQDYVDQVRAFNPDGQLRQYPGSPGLATLLLARRTGCGPTSCTPPTTASLESFLADRPHTQVSDRDGFESLKAELLAPPRRALIDPSLRDQDRLRARAGRLREALQRFADTVIMIWYPQLQLLESSQLVQRLKASADSAAKKGWLHVRLTVTQADERLRHARQRHVRRQPALHLARRTGRMPALAGGAPGPVRRRQLRSRTTRMSQPRPPRHAERGRVGRSPWDAATCGIESPATLSGWLGTAQRSARNAPNGRRSLRCRQSSATSARRRRALPTLRALSWACSRCGATCPTPGSAEWGVDRRWLYGLQVLPSALLLWLWRREFGELARQNWPAAARELLQSVGVGIALFPDLDPARRTLDAAGTRSGWLCAGEPRWRPGVAR